MYHPKEEIMISSSEDRSIKFWDMTKKIPLYTHKRDHDRFWTVTAHPKLNLFAAGHDSGLVVFKLQKERPPFTLFRPNILLYVKDTTTLHGSCSLRMYDIDTSEEVSLFSVRRPSSANFHPRFIHSHPQSGIIIVFFSGENSSRYELFAIPKKGQPVENLNLLASIPTCVGVAILKRDRFAVLTKTNHIFINNLNTNESIKSFSCPHPADDVFSAHTDMLLIRSEDRLSLLDVQQVRIVNQLKLAGVKSVVWSGTTKDSLVAIICRGAIVIANSNLDSLCSVLEVLKIKSGAWDENGTFIYSTLCHIKYILPNGDHGIVRTLDRPIYIMAVRGNTVYCLDRQGKIHTPTVDTTEYMFKHALAHKRFGQVSSMVKNSNLIGQAIIGYLQKKGYPEVALRFVKDERTRFNLALECATARNIDIAYESALVLKDTEAWSKLAREALRQGNYQIVEKSYQLKLDCEKLSVLYLLTGNTTKLRKMLEIATNKREDLNAQFQNSLLLGDVPARVKLLERAGQYTLAYMTAINHGLTDRAEAIRQKLEQAQPLDGDGQRIPLDLPPPRPDGKLLFPPTPIFRLQQGNWPVTRIARGPLDDVMEEKETSSRLAETTTEEEVHPGEAWGEDNILDSGEEERKLDEKLPEESAEGEGWVDDDALDSLVEETPALQKKSHSTTDLPVSGQARTEVWSRSSNLAAHRVASGKLEEAMNLLKQQIGIINFTPLKENFLNLYKSNSLLLLTHPSLPPLISFLEESPRLPRLLVSLSSLVSQLANAYKAFTDGKFMDAKRIFLGILQSVPLVVVHSPEDEKELGQLVNICKEYLIGLMLELTRKETTDPTRVAELAAYFTHCDLLSKHLQLTLKVAINATAKVKSFQLVQELANRLLDLNPPKSFVELAQKALKVAQSKGNVDETPLNYDPRNPFVLCSSSLTPIYQGNPHVKCPFCQAAYLTKFDGNLCGICDLAQVGRKGVGLQCLMKAETKAMGGRRTKPVDDTEGW
eukprot:TRINITY_DN1615_c0_g1_i9.p1 TRINITY_DN1615_c0_g1~~TRINITY_DN1615_c0_g1_i9.p1  ORF type:complete len:995 (+),score=208.01 TRINITY_DN1615_c0_g1_i9:2205-5189(+)